MASTGPTTSRHLRLGCDSKRASQQTIAPSTIPLTANSPLTTLALGWTWPVPEVLRAGEVRYLVGTETLGEWEGSLWTYYLPDALGSIRQAVDGAGALRRVGWSLP